MTIQQLLEMPIGEWTGGGFVMTAKHAGKRVEVEGRWIQNVTLTDSTGDMLADIILVGNNPIVKGNELKIIVCEIQPISDGKKLLVHEFAKVTCTPDELPQRYPLRQNGPNWEAIGRGKVKCVLTCAYIQGQVRFPGETERGQIARLADWVMSEKDIYK